MANPYLSSLQSARKHMESGDSIAAAESYLIAYDLKLKSGGGDDLDFIEKQIRTLVPELPVPILESRSNSVNNSGSKTKNVSNISDFDYASEFAPEGHEGDFSRVAGMTDLKTKLTENVIWPLIYPEVMGELAGLESNSVLLYGPPGCGKTFIAKSLAGEAQTKSGQDVNFYIAGGANLEHKYVGDNSRLINAFFETLQYNEPSIGFIDEIEGLAGKRSNSGQIARKVVNSLLEGWNMLDGTQAMVIAASNLPWEIDAAIVRSGRLEEKIFVPSPDFESRKSTFDLYSKLKNDELSTLAGMTDGYSSSAIRKICVRGGRNAAREYLSGSRKEKVVLLDDVIQAVSEIPSDLRVWADQTVDAMLAGVGENTRLRKSVSEEYLPMLEEALRIREVLG
ncbi:ATP-binding protein [Candidatus Woesearchaeota archaeon]|jgi:SpoVK/Ycf46/Vps4 family AAA+-type ATPase|nr:ATP-binding protein [Candidatus Woesearchaeota archaeon]MBT6022986.1 ATP-binding protein [Candidatus Woesearchaeota archaeon]